MSPVVEGDSSRVHETKKSASFIERLASCTGLGNDEQKEISPVEEDLSVVQPAKSSVEGDELHGNEKANQDTIAEETSPNTEAEEVNYETVEEQINVAPVEDDVLFDEKETIKTPSMDEIAKAVRGLGFT